MGNSCSSDWLMEWKYLVVVLETATRVIYGLSVGTLFSLCLSVFVFVCLCGTAYEEIKIVVVLGVVVCCW